MLQLDELDWKNLGKQLHLLSWQQRTGIVAAAWVVVVSLAYAVWWRDQLEQVEQQHVQVADSMSRLLQKSNLLLEQPSIEIELAKLRSQLPVLQQALPSDRELADLLDRIHRVIQNNGMGLTEFVPAEPTNQEVMRVVPVNLAVSGEGRDVSRLPNHVAQLTRQATLKDFDVNLSEKGGVWRLQGTLQAYAQLPANTNPPEETK